MLNHAEYATVCRRLCTEIYPEQSRIGDGPSSTGNMSGAPAQTRTVTARAQRRTGASDRSRSRTRGRGYRARNPGGRIVVGTPGERKRYRKYPRCRDTRTPHPKFKNRARAALGHGRWHRVFVLTGTGALILSLLCHGGEKSPSYLAAQIGSRFVHAGTMIDNLPSCSSVWVPPRHKWWCCGHTASLHGHFASQRTEAVWQT